SASGSKASKNQRRQDQERQHETIRRHEAEAASTQTRVRQDRLCDRGTIQVDLRDEERAPRPAMSCSRGWADRTSLFCVENELVRQVGVHLNATFEMEWLE